MENFFGRLLLKRQLPDAVSADHFEKWAGMSPVSTDRIRCNRCGTTHQARAVQLPIGSHYCPSCINLGRVRSDEFLYHLPQHPFPTQSYLRWTGQLTAYQQEISEQLIQAVQSRSQIMVHAVTGAGKTEMIYQAVDEVLKTGGAVCIASPRIDVCIELHKRLSCDFSCAIPLLHGEGEPYFRAPLVIATTHQLLRFRAAFDLLIIDEVDAFPFVDNAMLYFAVNQAKKSDAALIYLTATSTDQLEKQVQSGQLQKAQISSIS